MDTGVGIAREDFTRIFDPFEQPGGARTPGAHGTGIGLAITRKRVELHGGSIMLESEVGRGSTFTVQEIVKNPPDLVVMDIHMPDINGLWLTRALKHNPRTRDIPIVAVTAYAMIAHARRAHEAGCDGYIAKPIDTRKFPQEIARFPRPKPPPAAPETKARAASSSLDLRASRTNCARMKTIGVLGLGIIGSVWARHYHAAGVLAGAWNRTAQPDFPQWKNSPIDVAQAASVVQIVVADPPAVRAILEQILPALGAGTIVVQSSTIDPRSSDEFRALVLARGARYLEAPFTGSKPAAEQKQSVFFLGGEADLIAELEPLLALVSATRFVIGDHRQATALKLATNLNIAAQMQGLSEALTIARSAGISDDTFFSVLSKNVANSGLVKLKEPKLRAGDFSPQFSVKHLLKDMRLASSMNGCADMPMLDTLRESLAAAVRAGYGDEDFSAVIKMLAPQ